MRAGITVACAVAVLAPLYADPAASRSADATLLIANWVLRSRDNRGLPFMVIDKVGAKVIVFDRTGQFMGATAVLIGSARGDQAYMGLGDRELSKIAPKQRTTPAGRFVARMGPSHGLGRVLWVDIPSAMAMHPVITTNPSEHRVERLRSPTAKDNRITYGCINISPAFFKNTVRPIFGRTGGVVYILPETRPLAATFPAFRA